MHGTQHTYAPDQAADVRPRTPQHPVPAGDAPAPPATPATPWTDVPHWPHHQRLELGPVRLSLLRPAGPPATSAPGGRAGDGAARRWHLVFAARGPLAVGHRLETSREAAAVPLDTGDVVLCGPYEHADVAAVGARPARAAVLHLPEEALPLSGERLRALAGVPAPTHTGPAALLASLVDRLAAQAAHVEAAQTPWLGSAVLSLAIAFLDGEAGALPGGPDRVPLPERERGTGAGVAPSRADTLLPAIETYIEHRLADADLAPAAIAAAHHISLRYLHHLFQQERRTVGGFLRARRLERCCADLADPALWGRSVGEIGSRWGFRDPAVFNRTFKTAYGVTPGAYRRQRLTG